MSTSRLNFYFDLRSQKVMLSSLGAGDLYQKRVLVLLIDLRVFAVVVVCLMTAGSIISDCAGEARDVVELGLVVYY